MRVIQFVAATYPNGSVGHVTVITAPWETTAEEFLGLSRATDDLDEMYRLGRAIYHKKIGPSYSLDDMVDTFYLCEDEDEFLALVGQHVLDTEGLSFYRRPETVMVRP